MYFDSIWSIQHIGIVVFLDFFSSTKKSNFIIEFTHSKGLKSKDGQALSTFELAGKDGIYHPAKATIKKNKIIVSCKEVKNPVSLHFCWQEAKVHNLVNAAGLPAVPFRIED